MMTIGELRDSFGGCSEEEILAGCRAVEPKVKNYKEAQDFIALTVQGLLETNKYRAAARLLWGTNLFDARPKSVATLLSAIEGNAKVIALGAASSGKSYTIIAWCILDWLRDPQYTGIRIISTTSSHALENTFSSIQRLYNEAIIPLPGISQHGFIGLNTKDRHASLSVIAIKQGDSGKTSLQGFHPIRRPFPHPVFGYLSRIRIFLDEAELIPSGVWRGVGNISSNIEGKETVKIISACNPYDVTSIVAANAEPSKGWNRVDPDQDFEWISGRTGYKVVRLDAAYSENVLQKKQIYPGLMSYEGFEEKRSKSGGNDPEYWCFGRGMYPLEGTIDQLIPLHFLENFFGEFIFDAGTEVSCGSVDLAFEGDDCVFFTGRYGRATAWRQAGAENIIHPLEEPKYCLQLDQFITLDRLRTEAQSENILAWCKKFGISDRWLCLDKTGVGRGVHDLLIERGHSGILGIGWGNAATHIKTLSEHRDYDDEVYSGIPAQLYFGLRDYLEYGYIKANPIIPMDKLQKEIIGRKKKRSGKSTSNETMYAIEEKSAFKARYGFSPDRADALTMLLFLCRTRGIEGAQMEKRKKPLIRFPTYTDENPAFIDFSETG